MFLAAGCWVLAGTQSFEPILQSHVSVMSAVYCITSTGALMVLASLVGCCGAIKENRCMLAAFCSTVLVIFAVGLAGSILVFIKVQELREAAKASMKQYDTDAGIKAIWDIVQESAKCCGYDGPKDWVDLKMPLKCQMNLPGCKHQFEYGFLILGGIAIGILSIEIISFIFSCCIYRHAGKYRQSY